MSVSKKPEPTALSAKESRKLKAAARVALDGVLGRFLNRHPGMARAVRLELGFAAWRYGERMFKEAAPKHGEEE